VTGNATGGQSQADVQCPVASSGKQMKVFGGGAFGYSESLYQTINSSFPATNPGNTQTFAHAPCPSGKTPIGGGVFSDAADPTVNLNATAPESSFGWESYADNATAHDYLVTPYAVCVDTSGLKFADDRAEEP